MEVPSLCDQKTQAVEYSSLFSTNRDGLSIPAFCVLLAGLDRSVRKSRLSIPTFCWRNLYKYPSLLDNGYFKWYILFSIYDIKYSWKDIWLWQNARSPTCWRWPFCPCSP